MPRVALKLWSSCLSSQVARIIGLLNQMEVTVLIYMYTVKWLLWSNYITINSYGCNTHTHVCISSCWDHLKSTVKIKDSIVFLDTVICLCSQTGLELLDSRGLSITDSWLARWQACIFMPARTNLYLRQFSVQIFGASLFSDGQFWFLCLLVLCAFKTLSPTQRLGLCVPFFFLFFCQLVSS